GTNPVGKRRIGGGSLGRLGRNLLVGEQVGHRRRNIERTQGNARSALLTMQRRYILDTSKEDLCLIDIINMAADRAGSSSTFPRPCSRCAAGAAGRAHGARSISTSTAT